MNGGWSVYGPWSTCSVSCGTGQRNRTRVCDDPVPNHGGADCVGEATEIGSCTGAPCISK